MDVQHIIKYPEPKQNDDLVKSPKNLKQIQLLQDSLVMIGFDIEEIYTRRDALNIESTPSTPACTPVKQIGIAILSRAFGKHNATLPIIPD